METSSLVFTNAMATRPEDFPESFYDEQSIFKIDVNKVEGYLILLGRADICNPDLKTPTTEEKMACLNLSYQAITSGNILDVSFGSAKDDRIKEVKSFLQTLTDERLHLEVVQAYTAMFQELRDFHINHASSDKECWCCEYRGEEAEEKRICASEIGNAFRNLEMLF